MIIRGETYLGLCEVDMKKITILFLAFILIVAYQTSKTSSQNGQSTSIISNHALGTSESMDIEIVEQLSTPNIIRNEDDTVAPYAGVSDLDFNIVLTKIPVFDGFPHDSTPTPTWSNNGKKIAYTSIPPKHPFGIYITNPETWDTELICSFSLENSSTGAVRDFISELLWSPDDQFIAFGLYQEGNRHKIGICSVATKNLHLKEFPENAQVYGWLEGGILVEIDNTLHLFNPENGIQTLLYSTDREIRQGLFKYVENSLVAFGNWSTNHITIVDLEDQSQVAQFDIGEQMHRRGEFSVSPNGRWLNWVDNFYHLDIYSTRMVFFDTYTNEFYFIPDDSFGETEKHFDHVVSWSADSKEVVFSYSDELVYAKLNMLLGSGSTNIEYSVIKYEQSLLDILQDIGIQAGVFR